jgi:serine/threonine protein kinase
MFTDAAKSAIKITDWGLVKGEDYFTGTGNNGDSPSNGNASAAINIDRKDMESESLGLTAVAGEGNIGGTPDYCSPEQWFVTVNNNDRINDGRADIFSLGIILYEMLTRKRPPSYDPNEPNMSRKTVEPPSKYNSLIFPQLDRCILKMVNLKAENRQQSIWNLITEFKTLSDHS